MSSLQALLSRRAELTAELAAVEEAIKAFSDTGAVRVRTWRNIRNTGYLTTNPGCAAECLVVFSDEAMTTPADSRDHEGWVAKSDLTFFKLNHPEMGGAVEEVKR